MKQYTMYVCESRDAEDVRKHEASHLGLTLEELKAFLDLNMMI